MLIHYVFVRRDLPLGVMAAMVTHAAGESSVLYYENTYYDGSFRGAIAVVLEAKDEGHLRRIAAYLDEVELRHIVVHESTPPYAGQLMAIGLKPRERELFGDKLREFQCLKTLDNATAGA